MNPETQSAGLRPVALLVTDIEGNIRLSEAHPEHMAALTQHDRLLRARPDAASRRVFKTLDRAREAS
jgi:hypothetical protein